VRQLFLFLHLAGYALWMGAGLSIMIADLAARKLPREQLGGVVRLQEMIHSRLILPGALAVVVSGLVLTLRLYNSASATGMPVALMVMQGTGLMAASLVFVLSVPTLARLSRIEPVGPYAQAFDALRRKAAVSGTVIFVLAVISLVASALLR
jgi:hypothetical protein